MRTLPLLILATFLTGCPAPGGTKYVEDVDGDGIQTSEDCDDDDPAIGAATTYYYDGDADGHGDADSGDGFCDRPAGYAEVGDDCDDTQASAYPGAPELCDGLDNNCDGAVDEGTEAVAFYTDADDDGYGDDATLVYGCEQPAGTATVGGDCNDGDAAWSPGALEEDCEDPNDYNCDGSVGYNDNDSDGFAACAECNDGDPGVNPAAAEVCNGLDDDCDTLIDDADDSLDLTSASTFYADLDGDGFGDPASPSLACDPGEGWVADSTDCDDLRGDTNPLASEVCNDRDDDCDGLIDDADDSLDGTTTAIWYTDADADGYGDESALLAACDAPVGAVALAGDCDDSDAAYNPAALEPDCADPNDYNCDGSVGYSDADGDGWAACEECDDASAGNNPDAAEMCDGADNDCDGTVDEPDAIDAAVWYADADGDGFGDAATTELACDQPAGFLADATDCDDTLSAVNPAATELCNGLDDDCDGTTDEADAADTAVWYADTDGDGYGDAAATANACEAPAGYVDEASDCDDSTAAVNPAQLEACNGIDDDCNGAIDEDAAVDASIWYADADGDGYGDAATTAVDCSQPSGYVADATDCDDTDADVSPAGIESCNGSDDNCDGSVDESSAIDASTWYADTDADGYGDASATTIACSAPAGYLADATDCDDTDADVSPSGIESCNGIDDDCDGSVDESSAIDASTWYADADSDGYGNTAVSMVACDAPAAYVLDATDCDDAEAGTFPGAAEVCDDVDQDCDGTADDGLATSTWYADGDSDSWGGAAVVDCARPSGVVDNAYDCDDADAAVIPGGHVDCPWPSCLDLLDDGIASTDGSYWIDFDGTPTETECDMSTDGGGWTLVFSDDFDSGADAGWSTTSTYSCGVWGTILGGYGIIAGGELDIDVSTYAISHTDAWTELDYIALDSWDGELAYVNLDGTTVWSQTQNNHSSSYGEVCGWDRGYYGSYDSTWPVSETVAHTGSSLNVLGGSTLDQGPTDESFGLDDVFVWIR